MSKKITVKTGRLEEAAKEFIDVWHQVENGQPSRAPIEKISFKDQRLLFKMLTPKRFEILQYVHGQTSISIRALAKALDRDYSNVHQDVKILFQLGLMVKNEKDHTYSVPWDVIVTEIALPLVKKPKSPRNTPHQPTPHAAHG